MVMDYSERRTVNRNRPRRTFPIGTAVVILLAIALAYGGGLATGWFLFRIKPMSVLPPQQAKAQPAPQNATQPEQQKKEGDRPPEPSLTFYETLPKGGGKAILGTGLNLPKEEKVQTPAAKPAAAQKPASPQTDAQGAPEGQAEPAKSEGVKPSAVKKPESLKKYTVQVASCKARAEAEAVKEKLESNGIAAYVSENAIPGKGTWFRVKAGRHMEQNSAGELAAKIGGKAIVILE